LLLGGVGGFLGGILGYLLSLLLADLVGGTISKLYFFVGSGVPAWSWWIPVHGGVLGCAASLLGGAFPLAELVRLDPVRALQGRVVGLHRGRRAGKMALMGLGIMVVSLAFLPTASQHVYVGFAAAFGLLMGASLLTGIVLVGAGPALKWLLRGLGGLPGAVAAGNISRNLGRTAVAIAAFMVALSMSIGLACMIGSFRHTLIWWMESQLRGDLYIAPTREFQVQLDLYQEIQAMPGIGGLDPYRNVQIQYRGTTVSITAIDASVLERYTRFGWVQGGNEHWDSVKRGAVIISESFARRFGVAAGDTITLGGVRGAVPLQVAAVFYDYTTEHGLIMMDRSTYLGVYDDPTVDSLVVFMDRNAPDPEKTLEEIERRARARGLPVATRRQFHESILTLFDTTFAVTRSMRVLAVVVAFFGIAGALLTLFMERQRDFGIYRALGFSTSQVAGMTLMEGLGMGLVSFVLSTAVGTALAWVLIQVINLRSFNWTIFFDLAWWPYLLTGGTAILASLGAAIYPIWRVCRTYPQMQIREE
jgi:putative ABC transport system permease protein